VLLGVNLKSTGPLILFEKNDFLYHLQYDFVQKSTPIYGEWSLRVEIVVRVAYNYLPRSIMIQQKAIFNLELEIVHIIFNSIFKDGFPTYGEFQLGNYSHSVEAHPVLFHHSFPVGFHVSEMSGKNVELFQSSIHSFVL